MQLHLFSINIFISNFQYFAKNLLALSGKSQIFQFHLQKHLLICKRVLKIGSYMTKLVNNSFFGKEWCALYYQHLISTIAIDVSEGKYICLVFNYFKKYRMEYFVQRLILHVLCTGSKVVFLNHNAMSNFFSA